MPFVSSVAAEYPLDSIIVVPHGPDQLEHVASAVDHGNRFPWLPVLIGATSTRLVPALLDGIANGLHLATLPLTLGSRMDAGEIRSAIRTRGAPTVDRFTRHCGRRHSPAIEAPLEKSLRGTPLTRNEARLLGSLGRFGPPQWRALFMLTQLHADACNNVCPLEQLARNRETTRKTVSDWAQKWLGLTWRGLVAMAAWEAILELATRRSGYRRIELPRDTVRRSA